MNIVPCTNSFPWFIIQNLSLGKGGGLVALQLSAALTLCAQGSPAPSPEAPYQNFTAVNKLLVG